MGLEVNLTGSGSLELICVIHFVPWHAVESPIVIPISLVTNGYIYPLIVGPTDKTMDNVFRVAHLAAIIWLALPRYRDS